MGRPRVFVRVSKNPDGSLIPVKSGGREIHGLSFNKSNKSYYTIDSKTGNRQYHGTDLAKAVESVESGGLVNNPTVAWTWTPEFAAEQESKGIKTIEGLYVDDEKPTDPIIVPSKQKLSDCLANWQEWKRADNCKETGYIQPVSQRFNRFVELIGDKPISLITHDDFIKWQMWVTKNKHSQVNPNHWGNRHHQYVATVLRLCKTKNPKWEFPDNFMEWVTSYEGSPYAENDDCAEPMPLDVFQLLLAHADKLASAESSKINGNDFAINGKAMRQMQLAESDARRGLQYRTILTLACQTGFGWVDCSQLKKSDIKRSASGFPYVDLPRWKSAKKVGKPVERRIPLLPATVKTLDELARLNHSAYVFQNDHGAPLNPKTCPKAFEKFLDAAGVVDWTFKHLRNVGSNVADEHDLSSRMIDRLYGRVIKGVQRAYLVKSRKPEYLLPLVNLIGRDYFGGESVQ